MAVTKVQVLNNTQVKLFVDEMKNGATYQITISNVQDLDGNNIAPGVNPKTFTGVGVAPQVVSATFIDVATIDILFDEEMDSTLLEVEGNYTLTGSPARTVALATAQPDGVTARLTLNDDIPFGTYTYTTTVINVTDAAGNLIDAAHDDASFTQYVAPFRNHATLESGLVAHYKLDGNANDAYTNAMHGSSVGAATPTAPTAVIGTALDFTGTGGSLTSIALPASPAILDVLTNVSISFWVRVPTILGTDHCLGGRIGQAGVTLLGVGLYSRYIDFLIYRGGALRDYLSVSTLNDDAWYHIVCTYDGSNVNIYIDGALDSGPHAEVGPMDVCTAANPWRIGIGQHCIPIHGDDVLYNSAAGYIDEFTIWDRALTLAEVVDLYNSGSGVHF